MKEHCRELIMNPFIKGGVCQNVYIINSLYSSIVSPLVSMFI